MKKYFLSAATAHVLVWGVFFWLNYGYFKTWLPQIGVQVSNLVLLQYITLSFAAVYLLAVYFNQFVLLPRLYLTKKYGLYSAAVVSLIIFVCIVKVEIDVRYITVQAVWLRTAGHYISTLPYLLFAMGLSSWQVMAGAHRAEKQRADALQRIQAEAELKWLKAQVNPHFLFNALNNIYALVYTKAEAAGPMLLKLSDMMRYVITEAGQALVPVADEIKYMRHYIELNGLKKVNHEKTRVNIHDESAGLLVEPLLFINFIENAYKHGNMDDPGAFITIDWHITNRLIRFTCANTYNTGRQKDDTTGIGLRNVMQRLALAHPAHQLNIREQGGVYEVNLLIPLV